MNVTRRPATPADADFAREAHHRAYRDVVERQFGAWNQAQQDAFFDTAWAGHDHEIIDCDAKPAGYAAIEHTPSGVVVHELVVHPDNQNRGTGTEILTETISRARQLGLGVRLQVLTENRAADLYQRLGFEICDQTTTHLLMRLK